MSQGRTRAQRTRDRVRRWWPWLVLSAILHLPLTPLGPLIGLLTLLVRMERDVPAQPVEEFIGIPVELLSEPASAPEAPAGPSPEGQVAVVTPPKTKKPKLEPLDAGVGGSPTDAGPEAGLDAGVLDSRLADAAVADAGTSGAPDGGTGLGAAGAGGTDAAAPRPDPFAIAGELGKFQKGNVNVRVHLFLEPLRRHPAGAVIASLLNSEPQWQEFLAPGGFDLLADLERVVIMGPQLVDSSQVGAFIEGDVSAMRKAVDALVQHTEGARWETKNKKQIAHVHVAGADRVFVFYAKGGVAIVPPKPAEQLIALNRFPTMAEPTDADEILQALLRTPHRVRAFRRFGIHVPTSISLAKVFVGGRVGGGAKIRLELEDESPQAAATHASELELELSRGALSMLALRLQPDGSRILGEATLSPLVVGTILRGVQKQLPAPSRP